MRILVPCAVVLAVLEGCDAHACVGVRVPMWAGGWLALLRVSELHRAFDCSPARPPAPSLTHCHVGLFGGEAVGQWVAVAAAGGDGGARSTWLILPVVICLSQRLSHACLSSGLNTVTCLPWWRRVTGNQGSIPEREPEKRLPLPREAAGAQITHSRHGEVVTKNTDAGLLQEAPVISLEANFLEKANSLFYSTLLHRNHVRDLSYTTVCRFLLDYYSVSMDDDDFPTTPTANLAFHMAFRITPPLEKLAPRRPLPNVFNLYTLLTVGGQFAVRFAALYSLMNSC
ncbi:CHK1 checkpoint protein [Echinococcus multilocularis]|uniref:CHK1 checkpoint protein n=1 Tax=Echinococcus multilocularis TaxID=6211 RepID=A0A068XZB1_ECHMU|nr:CHK1 checkpoint protein [Echinococcus multilocularis]